jgi:hypothetical protein
VIDPGDDGRGELDPDHQFSQHQGLQDDRHGLHGGASKTPEEDQTATALPPPPPPLPEPEPGVFDVFSARVTDLFQDWFVTKEEVVEVVVAPELVDVVQE